jgi:hypothetical protein
MWDEVLLEMMSQHISIDLEEQIYGLRSEERLTQFQKVAGWLYLEYVDRYGARLPERVWKQLAETLDQKSFPLRDNLAQKGKDALDAILLSGRNTSTWLEAITYKTPADQPVPKEVRNGKVRYTGDLTRHAKKAIHRARDAAVAIRKR